MKLGYTVLAAMAFSFATQAQTVNWSAPIPVADASFGFTRPHVAVCNNVPVVVWGHESTYNIYASRYVSGSFTEPVEVLPNLAAYEMGWMAHEIAAAGDTLFVVFGDSSMSRIYIVRSLDGGQTFSDTIRVDDGSNGFMPVEPSVDIMAGGNPVVSFIVSELDFSNARTLVTHSTDGGLTFSPPVDATTSTPGEACDCCKGMMIAEGNRSILVFRNNENNVREFYASISNDGGNTFPTSVQLDNTNWNVAVCPTSPASAKLLGDTLMTVFMSAGSGTAKIYVSTVNLADTAQPLMQMLLDNPAAGAIQNYPRLAGVANDLGVVWQQSQVGTSDVRFARSVSGATGFGSSVNVSSSLGGSNTMPDVAYGNNAFNLVFENDSASQVYFVAGSLTTTSVQNIKNESSPSFTIVDENNGTCTLRFNNRANEATVSLYGVNGQNVFTHNVGTVAENQEVLLNTTLLSSGVYFVSVLSHQGVATEKLVINK